MLNRDTGFAFTQSSVWRGQVFFIALSDHGEIALDSQFPCVGYDASSDCLRSRHLPSTPLRLGEMNTKASLCSRKTNFHVPSARGLTVEAEMESQCGTVEFAGRDLSGLKNYFKLRSLSLACITGPEPARGRKTF